MDISHTGMSRNACVLGGGGLGGVGGGGGAAADVGGGGGVCARATRVDDAMTTTTTTTTNEMTARHLARGGARVITGDARWCDVRRVALWF
jgi:hypothetical protein